MTKTPIELAEEELQIIKDTHRTDLIIEKAQKLLALDPQNQFGTYVLITAYINSFQYDKVYEATTDALKNWPDDDRLYYYLYFYYLSRGGADYVKARDAIVKAIELSPKKSWYYRDLAEIYLINWEPEKAKNLLELAVKMDPTNAEYKSRLALASVRTKDKNAGLEMARKALSEDPDNHQVLDTVGMIYIITGELDEAEKLCRDALQRYPTREYYQSHLDWTLREKKDKAERVAGGKEYTPLYLRQKGTKRFFDEDVS